MRASTHFEDPSRRAPALRLTSTSEQEEQSGTLPKNASEHARPDGRTVVYPGYGDPNNRQLSNMFNVVGHALQVQFGPRRP